METDLKLDERVGRVRVVGVVASENISRLLVLALGDEPTRGLGHEVNESDLKDGGNGLEDRGYSPGLRERERTATTRIQHHFQGKKQSRRDAPSSSGCGRYQTSSKPR